MSAVGPLIVDAKKGRFVEDLGSCLVNTARCAEDGGIRKQGRGGKLYWRALRADPSDESMVPSLTVRLLWLSWSLKS